MSTNSSPLGGPAWSQVGRQGRYFTLGGRVWRPLGVNRYDLLGQTNAAGVFTGGGNSWTVAQLDAWFDEVAQMGATLVRFFAFQEFTVGAGQWNRFDYILSKAQQHGVKLLPVLEDQWGGGPGYKLDTWYAGGCDTPGNAAGQPIRPLGLSAYITAVVSRYTGHPAIACWQIMNESECKNASNVSQPATLLAFAQRMTTLVKSLDPTRLVSYGVGGNPTSPGLEDGACRAIHALPTVDIGAEVHDYNQLATPMIGDMRARTADSIALNKPFIIGEFGIQIPTTQTPAPPGPTDPDAPTRTTHVSAKVNAYFDLSGCAAVLYWSYRDPTGIIQPIEFGATDPLAATFTARNRLNAAPGAVLPAVTLPVTLWVYDGLGLTPALSPGWMDGSYGATIAYGDATYVNPAPTGAPTAAGGVEPAAATAIKAAFNTYGALAFNTNEPWDYSPYAAVSFDLYSTGGAGQHYNVTLLDLAGNACGPSLVVVPAANAWVSYRLPLTIYAATAGVRLKRIEIKEGSGYTPSLWVGNVRFGA